MSDEVLIDIPYILTASKRVEYKSNVISRYTTLIKFFQSKGLLTQTLLNQGESCSDEFLLMCSHFTPLGVDFFDSVIDYWDTKIDKGADPSNDTLLEKKFITFNKK